MHRRFLLVSALLLILSFHLHPAQAQTPESLIPQLAARLNVWRLNLGLGPVVYNPTLEAMAAAQADYLMTFSSLPNDLHAGRQGEDPRQRSQFEAFRWPTYGHPERIAVTEIAAAGANRIAVDYAINFWQNSDIHNRSVTNPNFREVGIAARQRGDNVLFIVVLGGRPGVLPALADTDEGKLYLTTERNRWKAEGIDKVALFRILDSQRRPVRDWQEWAMIVDLPTDLTGDFFYVEYEDAFGNRLEAEVRLAPVWSSAPGAAVPVAANPSPAPNASGNTPLVLVTNTPETPVMTATPVLTPLPGGFTLHYSGNGLFNLLVTSPSANLNGLEFRNGDVLFRARDWEALNSQLNIGAVSQGSCLQVWLQTAGSFAAPAECSYVVSIIFSPQNELFWLAGTFEVLIDGEVIATCDAAAGVCGAVLP